MPSPAEEGAPEALLGSGCAALRSIAHEGRSEYKPFGERAVQASSDGPSSLEGCPGRGRGPADVAIRSALGTHRDA